MRNNNSSHYRLLTENRVGRALLLVLLVSLPWLPGCSQASPESASTTVVATTSVLGDVASNIVGDAGEVEVLIPAGADPHDYIASARQVASLMEADLVITNGLGLEAGLHDILESAEADGATILEVGPLVDPIPFDRHGGSQADADHDLDPHIWLDARRMAAATVEIGAALETVAPGGGWATRAAGYSAALLDADGQVADLLATVPEQHRRLVTGHDALGYFADRYGFEIVGTVVPGGSTLAEPSSAELAALVSVIEQTGVPAIFIDAFDSTGLADSVAAELGRPVAVVALHTGSLGAEGSGASTLIELLLSNARAIAEALS